MASHSKNFISFVALGGPNPQILNIDFLKNNKILPLDQEPFVSISAQEKLVKKFVSVPGFTNLILDNIEFLVDESRFQIREKEISEWGDTKILEIAKKYFEILPYTPLKLVGINLNSIITFDSPKEETNFQELFISKNSRILSIIGKGKIAASIVLRYPYSNQGGRITLTVEQPNKENKKRSINFNYEFDFTSWKELGSELGKISEISGYSDSIIQKMLEAI